MVFRGKEGKVPGRNLQPPCPSRRFSTNLGPRGSFRFLVAKVKCLQHRCSHLRQVDQDRALLVALPVVLDIIGADQIHLFSSTRGKTGVSKTSRKFLLGSPKKLPTTTSARGAKGVFFCDGISPAPTTGCPTLFPVAAAMDGSAQPCKNGICQCRGGEHLRLRCSKAEQDKEAQRLVGVCLSLLSCLSPKKAGLDVGGWNRRHGSCAPPRFFFTRQGKLRFGYCLPKESEGFDGFLGSTSTANRGHQKCTIMTVSLLSLSSRGESAETV